MQVTIFIINNIVSYSVRTTKCWIYGAPERTWCYDLL